ncbi:F0F1 ATP synthase subunit epsilon [Candidatus Ozemobacteraceae bacterium]|nr:F0F1 ATP synthase subunit epsilon [Candidatus Ozemobacteraceae bacterium]
MSETGSVPTGTPEELMSVRVLTPTRPVLEAAGITSIKCETDAGRRTIEPRRLDGTAALVPGILTLRTSAGEFISIAIDEGILTKAGSRVTVSVRHAVRPEAGESLRQALEDELRRIRALDSDLRNSLVDLESRFMRQFARAHGHG